MDGTEVEIFCASGRSTTAEEMHEQVSDTLGLDPNYRQLFAIWVVSAALRKLQSLWFSKLNAALKSLPLRPLS
jgi:hypothetical protein